MCSIVVLKDVSQVKQQLRQAQGRIPLLQATPVAAMWPKDISGTEQSSESEEQQVRLERLTGTMDDRRVNLFQTNRERMIDFIPVVPVSEMIGKSVWPRLKPASDVTIWKY
ncbi:hypothetical protein V6N12_001853 [Hibiscus sabdariffa]|uniref:Uncharacterized protein n=1 Tax=Hibiscus sabdariffa TaxID=183260 RepID=A0ABR2BRK3_9ROSI